MSYGSVIHDSEPHGIAPNEDEVLYVSDYGASLTYSTSSTHTKGWFNNAIDWTCGQLAGTESPAVPPTLSSISACLSSENDVLTNMGALANPSSVTDLFFAKVLDTDGSPTDSANIVGKITFTQALNLTNQNAIDYLKIIGNKLDIAAGAGTYAKVGLNTYVSGTTESLFKTKGATIIMGQLTGLSDSPTLVVKDNSGNALNFGDGAYPVISNRSFSDANNTFTFNTDHFTSFEIQDTTAPTAAIEYSKDAGVTYTSTISVKDTDTLRIRATFSEPMADSPVTKIAIDNGVLVATDMTKTDNTHYYYDLNVPAGDINTVTVSLSVGTDFDANVVTATPTGGGTFTIDNTLPTLSETTPVTTPTEDNTPSYTFTSTEAGTITYGGDCSSSTTSAVVGANTVTFDALAVGAHSNCTITVTDQAGNPSSALAVTAFTVTIPVPTFGHNYNIVAASDFDAAIDSLGNIYTAYTNGGNVYVKKNRGSSELVSAGSGPAIAIDNSDNIHIIYNNSGLKYKKKTGAVWGEQRDVNGGTVFYSIDTDSNGYVHIASDSGGDGGRGHIAYVKDTASGWTAPLFELTGWYSDGSGNYYHQPVIRIDNNDKYHLVYEADNWGGRDSWSSKALNITSNSAYGDNSVGGIDWNTGVTLTRNALALDGAVAYIAYWADSEHVAKIDSSWTDITSFTGSSGALSVKNGTVGLAYVNGNVQYVEGGDSGLSSAVDMGTGSSPVSLLGSRYVFRLDGGYVKLTTTETILNTSIPTVTGVADEGVYSAAVTPVFDADATATLNGNPFVSGTSVSSTGNYVLIL